MRRRALVVLALAVLTACTHRVALRTPSGETLRLPEQVASSLTFVARDEKGYAEADPAGATGEPGTGKVTRPFVVRLTKEMKVYRLWAGPDVRDGRGNTSRLGSWWTFDRPSGSLTDYRRRYEVCESWNSLRWVAECTLRAGTVVVMGGGQSVSAKTCGDATGRENYPANDRDLQVYIREAFKRVAPPTADLVCPDESRDYKNDPQRINESEKR